MKGGAIEVKGNVTDWLGAEMTGGLIRVSGNAGGQVGAAYRGSMGGMKDGTIVIGGSAGLESGASDQGQIAPALERAQDKIPGIKRQTEAGLEITLVDPERAGVRRHL